MADDDPMVTCPTCQGAGEIPESQTPKALRSAAMKASIARRKAEGKPVGRGSAPDAGERSRDGYLAAWDPDGTRREATPEGTGRKRDEARRRYRPFSKSELLTVAKALHVPDAESMSRDALVMALDVRQVPVETVTRILGAGH